MADFPDPVQRSRLPDVVSDVRPTVHGALDWVGMDGIALPLLIEGAGDHSQQVTAKVSAYVNLVRDEDRGIHMSRLYRVLDEQLGGQAPSWSRVQSLLQKFLDTHSGLSDRARVSLRFELPVRRSALRSGLQGWRSYPIELAGEMGPDGFRAEVRLQVEYSSTCPGSAALSRQLIQHQFETDFPEGDPSRATLLEWLGSAHGICATPHAQRSLASVRVRLAGEANPTPVELIDRVEAALATPVQTAVKREDEQEFARLNGEHPMYCEDAVRRIRAALESISGIADYAIRARHLESLHPHDAVAVAVRGVAGGYMATPD